MAADIRDALNKLLDIQKIDLEILQLAHEKEQLPRHLKIFEDNLTRQADELKAVTETIKSKQLAQKQADINLQEKTEKINKYKTQMAQVKTNKEYQALGLEIEEASNEIRAIEDAELAIMEEIEQLQSTISSKKDALASAERELADNKVKITGRIKELDTRIADLKANKDDSARDIEPKHLKLYNRILKNKNGAVLAPVENRVCGGCNMSVTANTENEVIRMSVLMLCENCSRILYKEDKLL